MATKTKTGGAKKSAPSKKAPTRAAAMGSSRSTGMGLKKANGGGSARKTPGKEGAAR